MFEDIREELMEGCIKTQAEKHKILAKGWNAYWDGGFCYGVGGHSN